MRELRRESPRIQIEALCWEISDARGEPRSSLAVDLSSLGLRIERPYTGGPTRREVPLELEVPGIDEVMWARADACFDVLVPATGPTGGALGLIRRTGYRIVAAAARDLRMIEEFVVETDRANRRDRAVHALELDVAHQLASGIDHRFDRSTEDRAGRSFGHDLSMASCYLRA